MKLNFLKLLFLGLSLAIFLMPEKTFAFEPPPLIFSEIAWAGSSVSWADEWLVLKNTTDGVFDLTGWQITHLSGGEEKLMVELKDQIGAGGYYLISNYGPDESILNIEPDLVSTHVSLSNDEFQLKLYGGSWESGAELIDIAGDRDKPATYPKTDPISSMVRAEPVLAGELTEAWFSNNTQLNLDEGATELATPRASGRPSITLLSYPEVLEIDRSGVGELQISDPDDDEVLLQVNDEPFQSVTPGIVPLLVDCFTPGDKTTVINVTDPKGLSAQMEATTFCYRSAAIIINEVVPSPKTQDMNGDGVVDSQDEWIELYNPTPLDVELERWQLQDKAGHAFIFGPTLLGAGQYLVLTGDQTGVSLNDSGDDLYLLDPSLEMISSITWIEALEDATWAKSTGGYQWTTTSTPGAQNKITLPSQEGEPPRPSEFPKIKTGEANNYLNQWVEVEALVVEPEGSTFYIDDGTGTLKVYLQEKTGLKSPGLKKGYKVKVKGLVNVYRGTLRLLPRISSDIEILEKPEPLTTSSSSTPTTTALSEQTAAVSPATTNQTTNDSPPAEVIVETVKITTTTFPKLEIPEVKIAPLNFNLETEPFSLPINKQIPLFGLWEIFLIGSFSLVLKFLQWI